MFGSWLRSFAPSLRGQIMVGMAAMCWVCGIVANSYLQVIFRGSFWIRQWSLLSKEEDGRMMKEGCKHLEGMTLQLFGSRVWKNHKRLEA
ncbi:hypothetical protein BDA96_01G245700 [Sorghum bicolor]|uniref:Uncharacterized protein n=2 Tax=Sorghum bicolor TaxID=4558 RepID=A0A1Z5S705_SORBI|nr:hypothetical protein BDA96_01G245700 [Sorghum bicolor]OQU91694.1 hypothetical protein SORBI_3001G231350 [Sorghum bicolor]